TVAYDTNTNNVYDQGDLVIAGPTPSTSLFLSPSASVDYLGRIWLTWNEKPSGSLLNPIIYFKMWNGTAWSVKQSVTTGSSNDAQSFITQLVNQTMMILWSSNDTTNLNLYYTTTHGTVTTLPSTGTPACSWTPKTGFLFSTSNDDDHPVILQARDGTYWVFFQRSTVSPPSEYIFYATATD